MSKVLWNYLLVIPALFGGLIVLSSDALAAEVEKTTQQVIPIDKNIAQRTPSLLGNTVKVQALGVPSDRSLEQVTSVSQLSDVQPTDWAFQALQSLVERYGVIAGYPDGTFKGNRALTRYEFAAGLNAALDRLNELIATSTGELVRKEDLATLQKLQEQFASELATLRGRVDALETRQAKVEANQFSTTTKLIGDVSFLVADTFGDAYGGQSQRANNTPADDTNDRTQTFFAYRARLNFQTSFTGRDQLTTLLTAGNNIPNLGATTGTQMTRFTIDGDNRADTYLSQLTYRFPLGSKATVWVGPRALQPAVFTPTLNGAVAGLNGAVSRFATFNHTVYRPGFDGAGLALGYKFSDQLQLSLGYIADNNQAPDPTRGLFNGTNLALAQLTISPTRQLDIGLTYTRKYYTDNTSGDDSNFNVTGGTGSAFARNPFEQNSTTTDNFGFQFNWRTSRSLILGGWFGYTRAHQNRGGDSDATIINTALTVALPDLFKKGNVGGIIVGIPPKVTSSDYRNSAGLLREDPSTSLHLEAFYTYRVNDNITVTPDFYVITKPEHNDNNDAIWVGALRTTFAF
ncbi:Carbohydrate-selective porin OprB [Nostoc flagelliforme CCNUN1]|uniref:Carbohydrate-selective porin OprB n=1 Tax=Nostoc flagelliforme CCNUN1 TaxID=2038116 RepID=A0A2K8SHA1_9NOSO|nr:iron uptake porin [Nostoc flagelliforme]AUB34844.1 Carbohydrate-selective porin OprB [Nostoc flagelliforme CCNUN1]